MGSPRNSAGFGPHSLTDDGLVRVIGKMRQAIAEGTPGNHAAVIAACRRQQLSRFRLRLRYRAVDNHVGTNAYDRYYRFDEPPTYSLAANIDRALWILGRPHALAWEDTAEPGGAR